jgi:NADP-dependent 3-hydroxy acid dehydrogenase YdfG
MNTPKTRPADGTMAGSDQQPLTGTTALVTGASRGIGAAIALAIARHGGAVALVARNRDRLEGLAAAITEVGGSSVALAADLTDAAQITHAVQRTIDHFGRLDVLVNNAGYVAAGPFEHIDPRDEERMVDLNLRAVLRMSQAALPHLLRAAAEGPRGVADLVTVSSVAGRVPRKFNGVYSATKHAVVGFGEALRQEMTGQKVRVGLIEPGMTETELTEDLGASVGRGMPPEVWLRPDDVARCVIFMITQPPHAAINEILIRPTAQEH